MQLLDKYNRVIYFDDPSHKYTDNLKNEYTSTTTLIHKFEKAFDVKGNAKRMAREGRGQYEGKTQKEIEAQWVTITKEACDNGSTKHNNLENKVKEISKFHKAIQFIHRDDKILYTADDIIRHNILGLVDAPAFTAALGDRYPLIVRIVTWYIEQGFQLYAEVGVYDPDYLISGMIDLIAIRGNEFVILDWKTNKADIMMESGYYKKDINRQHTTQWVPTKDFMLYPLDNMPACKGSTYALQLSTYAKMMEDRGFTCVGIILIQIRDAFVLNQYGMPKSDDMGRYIVNPDLPETVNSIIMPYKKNEVIAMFDYHKKTTLKNGIQFSLL